MLQLQLATVQGQLPTFTNAGGFTSEGSYRFQFGGAGGFNQFRGAVMCEATADPPAFVGRTDGTTWGAADGTGTDATIYLTSGSGGSQLALDSLCRYMYFGQTTGQARTDRAVTTLLTRPNAIRGLTVSLDGLRLYFADGPAIYSHTLGAVDASLVAGRATAGYADGVGTDTAFDEIGRIVEVEPGVLVTTETSHGAIRRVDVASGRVATIVGSPPSAGTVRDPVPAAGVGTAATMYAPWGAYYHRLTKVLYVTELLTDVVRKIDLRTLEISGAIINVNSLGTLPLDIACDPPQRVCYVTLFQANQVFAVDVAFSPFRIRRYPVPPQ
eukprot:tig00020563_g11286.t2